jgi:hypothetical protein
MSKKLEHALHNEKICLSLCCDKENVDWIITTAFYSALHFVDHKLFPYTHSTTDGKKYRIKSFDEYYGHFFPTRTKDKHTVRLELVKSKLPTIAANYSWLKSTCWTARYSSYKFVNNQDYINAAQNHLAAIKACCT